MKAVIAIDSFKGSLSSLRAGDAVRAALLAVFPSAEGQVFPLADGGEGTVRAIVAATGGCLRTVRVTGPLGTPCEAEYGCLPDHRTAVLEMSAAAGLPLVPEDERDPMHTTTYGVGEMIASAIAEGYRDFIIGLGGSATNDGGVGMLSALGYAFLDADGRPIARGARGLASLDRIVTEGALPALRECRFRVACDVENPLCGARGASAVFGPQKGATPAAVEAMDRALAAYAEKTAALLPTADPRAKGAGAAGGLGFALLAYLGATLTPGISLVIEATGLESAIAEADLVITGEGRLDGQSSMGKAPTGVAAAAKRHGKPCLAFAGAVTEEAAACHALGIDAFFPILRAPCTLSEAMDGETAYRNLKATAEEVFRLMGCLKEPIATQGKDPL